MGPMFDWVEEFVCKTAEVFKSHVLGGDEFTSTGTNWLTGQSFDRTKANREKKPDTYGSGNIISAGY